MSENSVSHKLDDRPKENCGVVGIYSMSGTNVVPMAIDALRALQHRGQEIGRAHV